MADILQRQILYRLSKQPLKISVLFVRLSSLSFSPQYGVLSLNITVRTIKIVLSPSLLLSLALLSGR